MIDFTLIIESLPALLRGALISLQIAFFASVIGFVLGTALGFAQDSSSRFLRMAIGSYVAFFRGTPMLVQILFVYYVLPEFGLAIPPVWSAVAAIGLNSSAYVSQTIRSGISAVSQGQIDAAWALGFSRLATMWHIVLPQAIRVALPALGNELITLVKDSSLASIIGVMELSKEASVIRSRTYDAFSVLLAVSGFYLAMTAMLSFALKQIEKALKVDVYS